MLRVALLNGCKHNYDHDITKLISPLIDGNCVVSWLEVSTGMVSSWYWFLEAIRETTEDSAYVLISLTEDDTSIDTSWTTKVWIELDQTKIDDGSLINESQDNVASIETGVSFPEYPHIPLSSIDSWVITDERKLISLSPTVKRVWLTENSILITDASGNETSLSFSWNANEYLRGDWTRHTPEIYVTPTHLWDWSDWELIVSSGTHNLNADRVYNFSKIDIASGAVLTTADNVGILKIACSWECKIDGTINLDEKLTQAIEYKELEFRGVKAQYWAEWNWWNWGKWWWSGSNNLWGLWGSGNDGFGWWWWWGNQYNNWAGSWPLVNAPWSWPSSWGTWRSNDWDTPYYAGAGATGGRWASSQYGADWTDVAYDDAGASWWNGWKRWDSGMSIMLFAKSFAGNWTITSNWWNWTTWGRWGDAVPWAQGGWGGWWWWGGASGAILLIWTTNIFWWTFSATAWSGAWGGAIGSYATGWITGSSGGAGTDGVPVNLKLNQTM